MPQYEMGLRDYWRILNKRKPVILLTCLAAGALTYVLTQYVFRKPPEFSAACEVSVRPAEIVGYSPLVPINVAQQAKVGKSEMLLHEVLWAVEQFPAYAAAGLDPERLPKSGRPDEDEWRAEVMKALAGLGTPANPRVATLEDLTYLFPYEGTDQAEVDRILAAARTPAGLPAGEELRRLREKIVSQLQSQLLVNWDTMSSTLEFVVQTVARDEGGGRAAGAAERLAETIATVYAAYTEWSGRRAINREIRRIEGEVEDVKAQREQLEKERRDKQAELDAGIGVEEYQDARRALLAATDESNALRKYRDELDAYLDRRAREKAKQEPDRNLPPIPAPQPTMNPNIQTLYNVSIALEREKSDKLEFMKPDSHVIQAIDDKIERTAQQLRDLVTGSIANQDGALEVVSRRFDEAKKKADRPIQIRSEIDDIARRIGYDVQSLNDLTERIGRLSLYKGQSVKVNVIERPSAEAVGRAAAWAKTIVGALIGLIFGVVAAVVWETFDLTIGTIEEVESFLDTRVLGVVPHVEADKLASEIRARDSEGEAGSTDVELEQRAMLVTLYDPKSVSAEAFRHIRTTLDFIGSQRTPAAKVFLVTSATLYEGKTVTAANLAVVMAQNGKRTCLVECDFRRPRLHNVFGISRGPGLCDVLVGRMTWQEARNTLSDMLLGKMSMDAAITTPGMENLAVITAGTIPPNPAELLSSNETARIFGELRGEYDVVIVDSPPMLPVADAAVLAPLADGAVLVYRAGAAPRTVLSRAKTQLEAVHARLFGVVLNDLKPAGGEVSPTYPYKAYTRKAYELPEEAAAPHAPAEPFVEPAADRVTADSEDQVLRRIDLLISQGKTDLAVETAYDAATRTLPDSISVRLELARAYTAAGREVEAQAELLRVLDMDPRNADALLRLADMALDAGLETEALGWYEDLLEIDPGNADARRRADEIRARAGGPETA